MAGVGGRKSWMEDLEGSNWGEDLRKKRALERSDLELLPASPFFRKHIFVCRALMLLLKTYTCQEIRDILLGTGYVIFL